MDCCDSKFPDHSGQLKNLNKVCGQLEGVKKMIGERRYCPDIITQLRSARSALKSVEAAMLEKHLGSCVEEAMNAGDKKKVSRKVAELADIFKRFD